MLKNYLIVGFRNLRRQKLYTFINVLGLAIGLTSFMLISIFIIDELTYDKFHSDAERIYRMDFSGAINDAEFISSLMSAPAAQTLKEENSDLIEDAFRFRLGGTWFLKKDNESVNIKESQIIYADSNLFDFWGLPLLYGNPKTALNQPKTIALSESMSKRVFGAINPVGKDIILDNRETWKVGAVYKDIADNSHFKYEAFLTMLSREDAMSKIWMSFNFSTYFKLKKGVKPETFEERFEQIGPKYIGPEIQRFMNSSYEDFQKAGNYVGFSLFPMLDIHLKSNKLGDLATNGDIEYVYIFSIIGVFLLILACINFVNLSTARSIIRAKEVGMRKVLGAHKGSLIFQFQSEAILIVVVSAILALWLTIIMIPIFNEVSGKNIEYANFLNPVLVGVFLLVIIIVGFIAGIYPAFYLSSYEPVKTLKGNFTHSNQGKFIRKGLVVFQFIISIGMIISTILISNQLNFIQQKKLGYDKERLLMIEDAWILKDKLNNFKEDVMSSSQIVSSTISSFLPVETTNNNNVYWPGKSISPEESYIVNNHYVDHDYIPTLNLKLSEGRNFSRDFPTDSNTVIVNEALIRQMGIKDPLNTYISTFSEVEEEVASESYKIIGVIKDFHFKSLRNPIEPMLMHLGRSTGYITFKLEKNAEIKSILDFIEDKWESTSPGQPFTYSFVDDRFNTLHKSEQKISLLFQIFAFTTVFIACLGLFGLSSFSVNQRKKEIGIRKVLGASIYEIIRMLSINFLKPVALAMLISIPISWWALQKWLEGFAYRVEIGIPVFLISGLITLAIGWLTMSYQSFKAATANPIDSLRNE